MDKEKFKENFIDALNELGEMQGKEIIFILNPVEETDKKMNMN